MISLGQLAKSNAELVEKMVRILGEFSLAPATPDEAREPLDIKKRSHRGIFARAWAEGLGLPGLPAGSLCFQRLRTQGGSGL